MFAVIVVILLIVSAYLLIYLSCKYLEMFNVNTKYIKIGLYIYYVLLVLSIILVNYSSGMLNELTFKFYGFNFGFLNFSAVVLLPLMLIRFILSKTQFKNTRLYLKLSFKKVSSFALCLIFTLCLVATLKASNPITVSYDLSTTKNIDDTKIVFIADTHLSYYNDYALIEKMVNKINMVDADYVLIGGDIFNNNYDEIKNPEEIEKLFRTIKSKYGVYAVYGNHDVNDAILAGFTYDTDIVEFDTRFNDFIAKSNITLLSDETLDFGDITIIARDDIERNEKLGLLVKPISELTKDVDNDDYLIVLEHEPIDLDELSKYNIDLELSGHTHDGQIFPGNLAIKLFWDNPSGYQKVASMDSIVTSGVGTWGPKMRLPRSSEIVVINISNEN